MACARARQPSRPWRCGEDLGRDDGRAARKAQGDLRRTDRGRTGGRAGRLCFAGVFVSRASSSPFIPFFSGLRGLGEGSLGRALAPPPPPPPSPFSPPFPAAADSPCAGGVSVRRRRRRRRPLRRGLPSCSSRSRSPAPAPPLPRCRSRAAAPAPPPPLPFSFSVSRPRGRRLGSSALWGASSRRANSHTFHSRLLSPHRWEGFVLLSLAAARNRPRRRGKTKTGEGGAARRLLPRSDQRRTYKRILNDHHTTETTDNSGGPKPHSVIEIVP